MKMFLTPELLALMPNSISWQATSSALFWFEFIPYKSLVPPWMIILSGFSWREMSLKLFRWLAVAPLNACFVIKTLLRIFWAISRGRIPWRLLSPSNISLCCELFLWCILRSEDCWRCVCCWSRDGCWTGWDGGWQLATSEYCRFSGTSLIGRLSFSGRWFINGRCWELLTVFKSHDFDGCVRIVFWMNSVCTGGMSGVRQKVHWICWPVVCRVLRS